MSAPATKPDAATAEAGYRADPDVQRMLRVREEDDREAFRELFSKHSEPLVNFTFRFVSNRARAEELVQDIFLQIYRARHRYEAKAKFTTYLYRVATNLCLNERRRFDYQGKLEPLEGNPMPGEPSGSRELPDTSLATADELVAGDEAGRAIQAVLAKLPEKQKSALLLSRVEGFSYQEVADCLDTSVSAVKSLIFRATQTLRTELAELVEDIGS